MEVLRLSPYGVRKTHYGMLTSRLFSDIATRTEYTVATAEVCSGRQLKPHVRLRDEPYLLGSCSILRACQPIASRQISPYRESARTQRHRLVFAFKMVLQIGLPQQ